MPYVQIPLKEIYSLGLSVSVMKKKNVAIGDAVIVDLFQLLDHLYVQPLLVQPETLVALMLSELGKNTSVLKPFGKDNMTGQNPELCRRSSFSQGMLYLAC